MNEELVQNNVMNEEFVKNFVMNAKIDPKVVMDFSIFKIGGWNSLQPSNQNLLEEFMDESESWLLIGIPSRDSVFMIQYLERHFVSADPNVKELMPQHFAERYWLHEHPRCYPSWKESTRMKFMNMPSVCSKMRSESSEYMWKTTGAFMKSWRIKIALESYCEEHAQEVWERNWMNLEMQTTLLNTYPPKLISTILKALRVQLKENDQLHAVEETAGPVSEIPLEYHQILKQG